ncbi:MAG: T9SS type A sorting domain-containing protein [Bacteroidetes bacterium]|nr:T9SS type A sorting domain-containing protein [Bacteroidota bacterium]
MKHLSTKFILLFMLLFALHANNQHVQAQCQNGTSFGTVTAPAVIGGTAVITCQYASEYGTWLSVVAGNTYTMTSTIGTDFLTVRSLTFNGTVVAFGTQPVIFTAPVSGTYYIHCNTNNVCGVQNSCRNITMTLNPPPSTPTITSFSPTSGCGNSTSVVITGTNFTGATNVTFGGIAAQSFVVNNATQITAIPSVGNTGTIAVTTGGGTGTSIGTFTVNTPPTVTVTASTNPICSGSSTTLTAVGANMGGGGSYLYNPGALSGAVQTVAPIATTIYTVTATAANGCTATSTISIGVSPLLPIPSTTASPTAICPGGSSTLIATNLPSPNITVFTESFANNSQGWSLGTEWQIGSAVAGSGDPGVDNSPSPDNGIAGVVLGGAASTVIHAPYYITSPVINLSGLTTASLNFYRWLNSDYTPYMNNFIDVYNGATWVNIWQSGAVGISEAAWSLQNFNITAYINPNFRVRFGHEIGSGGAFTVGSWNIDDITITGTTPPATIAWTGPATITSPTLATTNVTPGVTGNLIYTITVTDAAGCTATSTVGLAVNSPTVTATASTNPVCLGGSTTLTGGGATSYVWTGGVSDGVSFAPLVTDTYTVTGTDGNSCTGTTSITVTVVPALTTTITQSPAGLLCGVNPTLTAVSTGGGVPGAPPPGARYYIRDVEPWGQSTNNTEMATVFGAYTTLDFAGANPATVFVPGTQFVFLEGSDGNANALNTYLTANLPVIENWVAAGGRLFLNAAPNQGGTINFGFGGTTCVYPGNFDGSVTANGAHPIVLGPALPTGTAYTGGSYAHANITNGGTSIIDGSFSPVLTEKAWGSGLVLFGGMTTTNFHQPSPNASNLRMNMLNYTANTPVGVSYTYVWQPGGATTPSIVAPSTGIYTVTVTSPSGCTSVATISVTINPAVTVSASASPTSICSGESATLTATGVATNYDWMPGALSGANVSVSPVANTIYTVTASDPSGCTSVSTVEVVVNPVPVVGAPTATPSTICEGSSSQLDIVLPSNPNNYLVSSIPFAPVTPIGPTNLGPTGDDNVSGAVNIGFPFTFYGTPYTSFIISTNGFISFNPAAGAGCCQGGLLPSNFDENNVVALAWNDLNQGAGGSIEYYNLTSPNRMVIQYSGVPQYGGGGSPLTGQIILYENGNIETHTTSVLSDGSNQTCGVEDATGTFGTAAPGRNSVSWGATNESWLFAPEAATVSWTPSGTLNNPAISNPVATPAATTTYTATVANAYGCTATQTVTVTVNPAPVVSATATPSTTCNLTSVNPCATGAVTYVWTGGLSNCTPFVATTTDTYTVTGTDGIGCTGTSSVTVTVNPASGTLAPITSNQAQDHGDDFNINYYAANCDLIATVDDGAGGNVLGLTTSTVNVDATASFHNGQPFVRRWYQITPTTNGSADVKLYINQTDFDDYNAAVVAPYLPLPTGPGDAAGIANIRITKNDDGGLGNNPIVITPAVSWNGTYWELSFNTPSFSQFRVHSVNPGNVPLPVTVTSFSGTKLESSDKLSWITSSEQNNAYFNLQHSTDGISFSTIAKVASKAPNGNSNTALSYTATNNKPALGHNYYRLQQVDIDNKVSVHAQIVDLIWGANGSTVSIYPNPTTDILNIDLYATSAQNTTVKLLDMSGRVIRQVQAKSAVGMNNIQLSLGEIASGVYTVQVYENNHLTHTSKVKKND